MPVADTVKQVDGQQHGARRRVPRQGLWLAQTPQVFRRDWLVEAYANRGKLGKDITDDAQLVEAAGHPVHVVEGAATNIKITTKADLILAEAILQALAQAEAERAVHPFAEEEMWGGRGQSNSVSHVLPGHRAMKTRPRRPHRLAVHLAPSTPKSLERCPEAELFAVASPTPRPRRDVRRSSTASRTTFTDYRELLELPEIDMVVLGLPQRPALRDRPLAAAAAGKHVVCEKPLCLNLAEADRMIAACRKAGVKLMYAEELCFTPKYVRAEAAARRGRAGPAHLVKQSEKHDGPHAAGSGTSSAPAAA